MDDHDPEAQPDDISLLWGADDHGAWEPAPLHRPEPPVGPRQAERLDALERGLESLADTVERLESLVNERLGRLEEQVAEMTEKLPNGQPRPRRLSAVIKLPRSH